VSVPFAQLMPNLRAERRDATHCRCQEALNCETGLPESELDALVVGDDSDAPPTELKRIKNNHAKPAYSGLCEQRDGKWRWFA